MYKWSEHACGLCMKGLVYVFCFLLSVIWVECVNYELCPGPSMLSASPQCKSLGKFMYHLCQVKVSLNTGR